MALEQLQISGVRNLLGVRLSGLQQVNIFFGPNGSGKTSLLESVHLLGMARSFRGNSIRALITHSEDSCTVFGASAPSSGSRLTLGVQRSRGGDAAIKVDGEAVKTVATLAESLPLQVITAESFSLLTGPPLGRRQYLDWGVFHVEHTFLNQWQRFQRGIKQRNMLLRRGKISPQELAFWTQDLAASGEAITSHRKTYFERLVPNFQATMAQLAPALSDLELRFRQGWDANLSYEEALDQGLSTDSEQGYTHTGPQRADLKVLVGGHAAADTLSRGQQKLVVCGLKLAQGMMMSESGPGECTYLIDDLPAELDEAHSRLVCQFLSDIGAQVFITCVEQDELLSVWPVADVGKLAMFHVEHGTVTSA